MRGLEKLEIGETYTYKKLCEIFGEERKNSNSKNSQLKEWERFFKWTKPTSQKYKIIEIYSIPLEKKDNRTNNGGKSTSKYLLLDDIIMDFLDENKEITTTIPKLSVELGILTEQYELYKNNNKDFCERNQIPQFIMNMLLANISNCVLHAIISSLNRLNNQNYINLKSFYTIVLNGGGKINSNNNETSIISSLEKEVESEMGLNRFEIISTNHSRDFKKRVYEKIHEQLGYDVWYYYKQYEIQKQIYHISIKAMKINGD